MGIPHLEFYRLLSIKNVIMSLFQQELILLRTNFKTLHLFQCPKKKKKKSKFN